MNTLAMTSLCKTYTNGVKALDNVSLTLTNGMFGLLGPNGAGKSTLMKTIAGLQPPDAGSITFNGVDVVRDPLQIKRQLGFLPQDFGVYPRTSALDLLTHIATLKGLKPSAERAEHIEVLLEKTNLLEHRKRDVHTFSGGMRQRFGIAQALLGSPNIVIVDEPTAGLDPEERNRFNNVLAELGEDIIVILSTHLVEDVNNLCTNMAIINKGRVLAHGKPAEFLASLAGSLWRKAISKAEKARYDAEYKVVSSHLQSGNLIIHILSESAPGHGFEAISPMLEDVYFSQLI
jgi:ABC-2 type transport system ATP-binding protein